MILYLSCSKKNFELIGGNYNKSPNNINYILCYYINYNTLLKVLSSIILISSIIIYFI
jgi:hypothetical protein